MKKEGAKCVVADSVVDVVWFVACSVAVAVVSVVVAVALFVGAVVLGG